MASEAGSFEAVKAAVPEHVAALDTALGLLDATGRALESIPSSTTDIREMARAVERAVTALLDAFDTRRDPAGAVTDTMTAIDEARKELSVIAKKLVGVDELEIWLSRAREWLALAEVHFVSIPPAVMHIPPWTVAGPVPKAHALARTTIAPIYRVADPVPPAPIAVVAPADLPAAERIAFARERGAELREASRRRREERELAREARARPALEPPPKGFVPGRRTALTRRDQVLKRARELFEEIALCGMHRTPMLGDAWRTMDVSDQRMLRAVDAVVALGSDAVATLERLAVDSPAKDPARGFAAAFALGCFAGRDALAAAERVFRYLGPADPEVRSAIGAALKLVPHPELERVMRAWTTDDDSGVRAVAIEVLGHRSLLIESEVAKGLEDPSLDVVAAALRWGALGPATHRVHLRSAMVAHEKAEHEGFQRAHAWALVLGGVAGGLDELRGWLGTPKESLAALPLALAGDQAVAKQLVDRLVTSPTEALARAVGFAGPAEALNALTALLSETGASPDLKLAAAFALQRITGLEQFEDVDLPPEKLDADELPDPPAAAKTEAPLTRKLSDPRDMPSDGAPDRLRLPSPRAEVWLRYLSREAQRYQGSGRFRRGKPYTPALSLDELDRYAIVPSDRRAVCAELIVKTGEVIRVDPHDFVVVQEAGLKRWAPLANRASSQPGAWLGSRR